MAVLRVGRPSGFGATPAFGGSGGYEGGGGANGELYRIDQLRRTFQPRRFGSGYDPMQVDRLFESILQAMSGRGPMPVPENELDTLQFGLVPGGYFEAEVDAALREVKDILLGGVTEGPASHSWSLSLVGSTGRCGRSTASSAHRADQAAARREQVHVLGVALVVAPEDRSSDDHRPVPSGPRAAPTCGCPA